MKQTKTVAKNERRTMINQNIFVYSSKNAIKQKITATQADSGRVLICNMADITVDASYTARIYAVKPSELKIYNDCTIVGNAVVVDLTTQILAEHGLVKCQIELADGEKKVTSFLFEIDVKETLVDVNAIESTDEFTTLEKALSEAGGLDARFALKADLVQGKVPASQLPSYVDDVLEYENVSAFPSTGESGKIYIALDTNKTYRWGGTEYVLISDSIALGETAETAYRGDRGKTAYDNGLKVGDMSNAGLPVPYGTVESNIYKLNSDLGSAEVGISELNSELGSVVVGISELKYDLAYRSSGNCVRWGNIVMYSLIVVNSLIAGIPNVVDTIPVGYRPVTTIRGGMVLVASNIVGGYARATIGTNGEVSILTNTASYLEYIVTMTYITNDAMPS